MTWPLDRSGNQVPGRGKLKNNRGRKVIGSERTWLGPVIQWRIVAIFA